ncbi:FMN-binding protein [Papillibacter cinnamivorans]|uniref:Uncharacterized protein, contains FMN-binding domain n=1 Tax=Papillibacter cinnamivorans DSM 12816 TaxID=1122930 RepID=A0A1W2AV70_9FIRM|nr:FMN-binding protein [Papillibacter cinnamivorans]SMC64585.1 Uncharacterized protein, contains FMN-binding domain [Papillibacter cinnamivorans DSM 12816]
MKKIIKIILIALAVIALVFAGGMAYLTRGLDSGSKLLLSGVDPSSVRDGTYAGTYEAGRWTNEVAVTVKDGAITEIRIVNDVVFPLDDVTDELLSRVITAQDTRVDAVSGATVTCKAYLKSIENALTR